MRYRGDQGKIDSSENDELFYLFNIFFTYVLNSAFTDDLIN